MQKQLFLLNFYKLLSNIATKLVGAFIPVIILDATGSLVLACASVVVQYLIRLLTSIVCRKFFQNSPQLALMIRIVPVVLYSISILLIETNLWVGVIGSVLFYGFAEGFKTMPLEVLYNYASTQEGQDGNSLGVTRLLEQLGVLLAFVVGGVMLDVNKTLILIVSVVIYIISVIPLVVYYVRSRNQKGFNADAVSNAVITFSNNPELVKKQKKFTHKMLFGYAIVYFIFSFMDVIGAAYVIHLYLTFPSFGMAGYMNALYSGMFGLGCFLFGIIDSKKETTPLLVVSCVVCAVGTAMLIFVKNVALLFVLNAIIGLFYGNISTFCLRRLLPKARIMGAGNRALFNREITSNLAVMVPMLLGMCGSMIPVLAVVAGGIALSGYLIPANEEYSRKLVVDYLQNHEIMMSEIHAPFGSKKSKKGNSANGKNAVSSVDDSDIKTIYIEKSKKGKNKK